MSDLREAAQRVVDLNRHEQAEGIDDLRAAIEQPDPETELNRRAVIEDVIRELEFERQARWVPVIERLRSLL